MWQQQHDNSILVAWAVFVSFEYSVLISHTNVIIVLLSYQYCKARTMTRQWPIADSSIISISTYRMKTISINVTLWVLPLSLALRHLLLIFSLLCECVDSTKLKRWSDSPSLAYATITLLITFTALSILSFNRDSFASNTYKTKFKKCLQPVSQTLNSLKLLNQ